MYLKILLFIVFSITIFSDEMYKPKSLEEQLYLEKIRKKEFILSLQKSEVTESIINGTNLNKIILELFEDYLNLNVKVEKSDWNKAYLDFKNGKSDAIGLITRRPERKSFTEFSKKIFGEDLYLVSRKEKIVSKDDLKGKPIFIYKNDSSLPQLHNFFKRENISNEIIEVDDIMDHLDGIVLSSGLYANGQPFKIKIGYIPDTSIGVSKEYAPLIPILNNALSEKYEEKIDNYLINKKLSIQRSNFKNKLTEIEKDYLKKVEKITVGLESDSTLSRYSKKNKNFTGIIPNILKKSSQVMDIEYKNFGTTQYEWNELYKKFLDKKIQVLPTSLFNSNFNQYLFSDVIYSLKVFLVTNKKTNNQLIGVLKNSVYEDIAKMFFFPEQIITFSSNKNLLLALQKLEIDGLVTSEINEFDENHFETEELSTIPIVLAFQKEDDILRGIFNKALESLGNSELENIITRSHREENKEIFIEKQKIKILFKIFIAGLILALITIFTLIYKFLSEKNISRTLRRDFLTNLPNRVLFNEFCQFNQKNKGTAIFIDLNNFKQVNDKFSHKFGDQVLIEVAKILKEIFGDEFTFRISGDEFYSFLLDKDYKIKLAKLKLKTMRSKILINYNISFSLGYYLKSENESLEDAFKYAGMAMREAKLKKEYFVVEASPELIALKTRELKIKEILNDSIKNELYLVFQPKVNALNPEIIVGAEALCRWENEELGFISPTEFISLAEDLKIIHSIDFKIAEETIKTLKEWIENNKISKDFRLSFNLSMQTFDRDDIVSTIEFLLNKYGVSGKNLEIEITESTLSTNISKTLEKLKYLKELDISIALDDFTAGYSTTALLPVLPIDIVKFDKSLIDLFENNRKKGTIIYKTLIKMTKDLNLTTVAEGIELKEQYLFLKKEKIDIIQGYYFGKPVKKDFFNKN